MSKSTELVMNGCVIELTETRIIARVLNGDGSDEWDIPLDQCVPHHRHSIAVGSYVHWRNGKITVTGGRWTRKQISAARLKAAELCKRLKWA